jgi:hypothetical protein
MRVLKVHVQVEWDRAELVAIVTEQDGKVTIDYKDEDSKSFLEPVKLLGHSYFISDEKLTWTLWKAFSRAAVSFSPEVQS